MLKKRIAALTMGAALATSAFLAPQAAAGTPDFKCEKGYELVAGTHKIGGKVEVEIPKGFEARDLKSQDPANSLERDGKGFKIKNGEQGKNTVTLTFEKGKGKKKRTETTTVKYTLDKCEKKKGDDKKGDKKPVKSSVDHKSFTLSSKK